MMQLLLLSDLLLVLLLLLPRGRRISNVWLSGILLFI